MTDYVRLCEELTALINNVPYPIANLANASALLFQRLGDINWAGFYLAEGDQLILGPFQGKPACIQIPFGKGVCGTAWQRRETIVVEDVEQFPGHIACSSLSRSEIVVPLSDKAGTVRAVLDIDSTELADFDDTDRLWLERMMQAVSVHLYTND